MKLLRGILLFLTLIVALVAAETPRLAVAIAIDQCRADYLERFRPWFVEGGFKRVLDGGAVYASAYHRHAMTATAPGHATLLSGVHANVHGIVANEWFDFSIGRKVAAVYDPKAPLIGAPATKVRAPGGVLDTDLTASPAAMRAPTVGDELKLRYGAQSKVIGLANKDRGAIFLAGRMADAAYWFHAGRIVSSTFYRAELPAWVAEFNASEPINRRYGQVWDRLLPQEIYDRVQGPDAAEGEETPYGLGATFPRRVDGGRPQLGSEFHNAYRLDPHCSEVLGELARRAIVAEQLGQRGTPDLLCLSFSQLDYCGHSFGPDSHEIMDSVLRLDRVLAELFTFLDQKIGPGHWTVVISADHGVAPLPERVAARGRGTEAGRVDYARMTAAVEAALTAEFGQPGDGAAWTMRDGYGYRLIPSTLAARQIAAPAARRVIKAALERWPQVGVAWTREELLGPDAPLRDYLDAWRLSYQAERSQDVVFSPKPYIVDRSKNGTNHGTPYDYDAHIPLVWYGAGVPAGVHVERVGSDAIAPTLSRLLGIPPPPQAAAAPLF